MADVLDTTKLDQLKKDLGGLAVVADIVQTYLDEAPKLLDDAENAVEAGDAESLRIAGHTLKSSSRQVGAEVVGDLAEDLEEIGDEEQLDSAGDMVAATREAYDAASAKLREYVETAGVGGSD